jgi:UDP-N-acetylglucosamine acyltransferase
MSVHSTAIIDPRATIDPSATIGAHAVIDGPVRIGAGCHIAPLAVIMGHTLIEAGCHVHAHAVIGDVPQDRAFQGSESYCHVGENSVIREGVTIHRGTKPGSTTTVGRRCLVMTNAHIGHNCTLGDDIVVVSGALLGGYVQVGSGAVISGGAAIHQFVRVGNLAMVSGLSKVVQDVPPYFMTDREGGIIGENRIGMRRAGLSTHERLEIRDAFRIIYRSKLGRDEVLDLLQARLTTTAGRMLYDFLATGSQRGVCRESIPIRRAA